MSKPKFITSTEICEIMKFHKRTLHRRLLCPVNPLPMAVIKRVGSVSLFDQKSFYDWVEREKQLEILENTNIKNGDNDE